VDIINTNNTNVCLFKNKSLPLQQILLWHKFMNKVMLIGNVGVEPEVRYVDAGVAVASIRLATTERGYRLPNGTDVPDRTEWHNIVLWRQLAETVEKYVHKGDKLYIEGKLHTRSYDDRSGQKRYVVEIWADAMEMLSTRRQDVPENNVRE
jgi:single-strand DNA-binding protein